ncbi:MAG: LmbE family protein [Bacteroidetes bacterium]|nr:LmbE family protein [Bacteroidota bacterium]
MEARKIDGGQQFFTRAIDFGYSKSPEETLDFWGKERTLADVVFIIRRFRPDVIINRFRDVHGRGHGHHTASAMLAREAFKLAGDITAFPEQLEFVEPWNPARLLINTSSWWNKELEKIKTSNDTIKVVDVGKYSPLLGKSYNEIASESRSQHRSQGFGSTRARGSKLEYIRLLEGQNFTNDMFEGIDQSWLRVEGGKKIGPLVDQVIADFNFADPSKSIPRLLKIRNEVRSIQDPFWKKIKLQEIENIILNCTGLWIEVHTMDHSAIAGGSQELTVWAVNRMGYNVRIKKITFPDGSDTIPNVELEANQMMSFNRTISIGKNEKISQPYWLDVSPGKGYYEVGSQEDIGKPVNENELSVSLQLGFDDEEIVVSRRLVQRSRDRVKGELYQDFIISPAVTVNPEEPVYLFRAKENKTIRLTIIAHDNEQSGELSLDLPKGWTAAPTSVSYNIMEKGSEQLVSFKVEGPDDPEVVEIGVVINGEPSRSLNTIEYDHIQTQYIFPYCKLKFVKLDLQKKGSTIGYIHGSGDEVPKALSEIGYKVELLNENNLGQEDLAKYDAVIVGVRGYNTNKWLGSQNYLLLDYVKAGGTLIVQYSTTWGLISDQIGPFPFKISRDRVTTEDAIISFIEPKHPLLNVPNRINLSDFDGWVQERGLYFANEWDDQFTPLLSWSDPGETAKQGSLIVAEYGKGHYIYTGISFFRQLPAGVPGAYRLFANLVSLGN